MKKGWVFLILIIAFPLLAGVYECGDDRGKQEKADAANVDKQQEQYAKGQPIPFFDWSLERDLILQLYKIRNAKVATHAVWRANYGMIEGDCPSMGFGIPYDTSLTNPLKTMTGYQSITTIEQAEPNGIFASKNTSATWVMCIGDAGIIEPVYIESKVTIYPGPVDVDYNLNRVTRSGKATVTIKN
jgi:hypothetical protein